MPICSAIMDMGTGPGPGLKKGAAPAAVGAHFLGPGPGPISTMAEHMGIKGKQYAIDGLLQGPKKGSIARAI